MPPAPYQPRRRRCITRRHNRLFAVLDVPKDVRPKLGKTRFMQALGTSDMATAERVAGPILSAWRRAIVTARGDSTADPDTDPDPVAYRRALRNARSAIERDAILERVGDEATELAMIYGAAPDVPVPVAGEFYAAATAIPFDEHLAEWQATERVTAKTRDMQATDIRRFTAAFPTVADVTKPAVKRWTDGLMAEGLTGKTVQRILSALRGYWKHLQAIEVAPAGLAPFSDLNIAQQGGRVRRDDRRQPFTAADVVKLLGAARARGDVDLADVIDMARWTGARIEELCSLRIEHIHLTAAVPYLSVVAGKTDDAVRDVPIHAKLLPVLRRLIGKRTTGYVLVGLTVSKYGDRSDAVGKRFGHMKTRLGFNDQYVFHSIRKTVATLLEDAGVAENITASILGHRLGTMSYGVYSGGPSVATKAKDLAKLSYPKE